MISIRVGGLKSWFDPKSVPALSCKLCNRLTARMKNKRGLFITLTYNRTDYKAPIDLFFKQQERQDVPRFIRRLQHYLGTSLSGKWMRKMEFQGNGWVHFHIVLDYPRTIPHSKLTELWGWGHVWVERWSPHLSSYLSKYIGKGDKNPGWILMMKPKTVKIVSTSPGFWNNPPQPKRPKPPKQFWAGLGVYVPIGARLEELTKQTLCRIEKKQKKEDGQEDYRYFNVKADIGSLICFLMSYGIEVTRNDDGWLDVNCNLGAFKSAAAQAALHLINRRNPAKWPNYIHVILRSKFEFEPLAEVA